MCLIQQAREFRVAYGCVDSTENELMQFKLIEEEFKEFNEAAQFETEADALKELADLVYVCAQYAANQGWDLDTALARVHESNMSKTLADGTVMRRADGKVLKGPNYKPPVLTDLVPDLFPVAIKNN